MTSGNSQWLQDAIRDQAERRADLRRRVFRLPEPATEDDQQTPSEGD